MGVQPGGGNFHPLLKVRAEFRRILMEMGFEEMPTNRWVCYITMSLFFYLYHPFEFVY